MKLGVSDLIIAVNIVVLVVNCGFPSSELSKEMPLTFLYARVEHLVRDIQRLNQATVGRVA